MRPYLDEQTKTMTLRSLKVFLMVNLGRTIPPYEIENLADYLDPDGDGFITWQEIERGLTFGNA
jgi:Ca2+-binding EF-hand superfamily protein